MSAETREIITWLNAEIARLWPIVLALLAAAGPWLRGWRRRRKAEHMDLLATLIGDAMATQLKPTAAVVAEVREQVSNDHSTNLRDDLDHFRDLQVQESQIRAAADQRAEAAIADLRAEQREYQAQTHSVLTVLLRLAEGSGPPTPRRPHDPA